jgi:hypothetical protein
MRLETLKREEFMWDRLKASAKHLSEKAVFLRIRLIADSHKHADLTDSERMRGNSHDRPTQAMAFHPDDHDKRDEYSLHIGC